MEFWLCFVPMFVAVDAIGVLPMYLSFVEGFSASQRRRVLTESLLTAFGVTCLFLLGGQQIFRLLGITAPDFMIAGGILLFLISVIDLLSLEKKLRRVESAGLGVVPLGVPLIAGPAVLTTTVLLGNEHGLLPTISAVAANIAIAGVILGFSHRIHRALGSTGARVLSKITSLILAAIGVMMVRKGIAFILFAGSFS